SAANCLAMLNAAFPPPLEPATFNAVSDQDLSDFDHLSKFIDSFCASGHTLVGYDIIPHRNESSGSYDLFVKSTKVIDPDRKV
ncbi:hypothetical protein, partial [Klebsiella aerogenes]|uniref:hypothetical protein n=1 Tax=Klebsiella aerogenes TaxID=548 RepID=UPI001CC759DC